MLCPSESWVNLDDPPCPDTDAVIPSCPTMRSTSLICPTPRSSIFYNSILQQFEQPISFPSFIPSQYLNIHNAGFFSPNTSVLHSDYPNFTSNCTDTNDLPSMFLLESRHVFPSRNHTSLPATSASIFPSPCDMSLPAGTSASQTSIVEEFIAELSPPHFMPVTICSESSLSQNISQTSLGLDVSTFQPLQVESTCSLHQDTISQTSLVPDFDVSSFQPLPVDSECSLDLPTISQTSLGLDFDDSTFQPLPIDSECSIGEAAISQASLGPDFAVSRFQPLPVDSECSLDLPTISETSLGPDFDDSTFRKLQVDSACSLDQASISQTSLGPEFHDATFRLSSVTSACSLDEETISQTSLGPDLDDSIFSSESNLSQDYNQTLMKSIVSPVLGSSGSSLSRTISQVSSIEDFSESILIAYSFQL
ncbi:uncharacterized protein LOC125373411 [Haliotis rufescens]|uniref:uncharacterized protein LOC125373411 n=1 Tax=Haliotis rufescens TaxID=6454 RepID=UPI00201EE39E|nr:uncharacterized protein LOC125373411 [Haliotis rufescens]